MSVVHAVLRKLSSSRNSFLIPNSCSRLIFCEKSSKIGSTSDASDNEKSNKKPEIKQKVDSSSSSSSSSSSDDEIYAKNSKNKENTIKNEPKPTNNEALNKLNNLLKLMVEEPIQKPTEIGSKMAKPTNKRGPKEKPKKETTEEKLTKAAKNVAESLGGDAKQTESELLAKLRTPVDNRAELSDILKGMKIDRDQPKPVQDATSRSEQVRHILDRMGSKSGAKRSSGKPFDQHKPRRMGPRNLTATVVTEKINLFEGDTLGIFSDPSKYKESPQLPMWKKLDERDLKLAVTHPPSNYFQEMILWTEQGKVWNFPIDNEYGLEEESKVYFADHVFLERHLEPWCPKKGPIRHFMELVCVGLSKNPYISVKAKKEHIEWYKNYFEDKMTLLKEIGAIPIDEREKKPKQIES